MELPNEEARLGIVKRLLPPEKTRGIDYQLVAATTQGYSGSDLALVCKEAAMRPVRRLMQSLEELEVTEEHVRRHIQDGRRAKNPADITPEELGLEPTSQEDVQASLAATKPSARLYEKQYLDWAAEFGSVM